MTVVVKQKSSLIFNALLIGRIMVMAWLVMMAGSGLISDNAQASDEKPAGGELTLEAYLEAPPIIVTMYHRGRPKGNMTITLKIKLVDDDKRAQARKYMPRLSSAFVMEASRLSYDYFDVNQPVNIALLGDSFQQVANRILGHGEAQILINDVVVRKK